MPDITYGSVCSGIEAATQAWHPLGMKAAWFAEIEPLPSAVLAHHYPDVPNHGADGKPFTKTQQVHMCGNSVSPPPMAALARANDPWRIEQRQAVAA